MVTAALQAAVKEPKTAQDWKDGPHSEAIAMIDSFAKGQTGAPHGTALCALLDLKLPATPDGAAQLLKQVGYWPAHLPNALVRLFAACLPTVALYASRACKCLISSEVCCMVKCAAVHSIRSMRVMSTPPS